MIYIVQMEPNHPSYSPFPPEVFDFFFQEGGIRSLATFLPGSLYKALKGLISALRASVAILAQGCRFAQKAPTVHPFGVGGSHRSSTKRSALTGLLVDQPECLA